MASSRLERIGTIFTRKNNTDNLIKSVSEVLTEMDADYNAMKENDQKLEQLTNSFIKCLHKVTIAQKQTLKSLNEIHSSFKKNVEGLLTRGAMKPDDRPVWFDVYKAFPPLVEPKFARPKPEIKPIKQILYHEDEVRAKFHSNRLGLGTVNLLNPSGDTRIKKLVQQYEKLKLEGVPENEILEKSAAVVDSEWQESTRITKTTNIAKEPESVSSQILSGASLKNILDDK